MNTNTGNTNMANANVANMNTGNAEAAPMNQSKSQSKKMNAANTMNMVPESGSKKEKMGKGEKGDDSSLRSSLQPSAQSAKKVERRFRLSEPLIKFKESKGKIVDSKNHYGMYSDPIPLSAARKCYRRIARSLQLEAEKAGKSASKVNQRVVFCLLELGNRGVEIDQFYYVGDNKLKKPMTRFVGHNIKTGKNKTITTHVKPHVQALTKTEYMSMTAKPGNSATGNMPANSGPSKSKSAPKSASASKSKAASTPAMVNASAPKNNK